MGERPTRLAAPPPTIVRGRTAEAGGADPCVAMPPAGMAGFIAAPRPPRPAVAAAILACWALAAYSWVGLYRLTDNGSGTGWDLLITWRAEKVFAHGGAPYSVRAFLYPPSSLLLLRPLALLTRHQLVVGGLVGTLVLAWLAVMVAAVALGRPWWGLTAALTIWLLHFTTAMKAELALENVTVLSFLALSASYLFARRDNWVAAGAAIGLSLAIKPLLIVVLIVFILARQWKALAVAVVIPVALNALAFALVADPGEVWSKLPSLLNRSGTGVYFNSAWVDVARTLGMPDGVAILLRVATVAVVAAGTWLAWTRLADPRLRIVTTTSTLLIGSFLAGTLSESHFMLTLVPFAMALAVAGSVTGGAAGVLAPAWILGMIWLMGRFELPSSLLALNGKADVSAFRAFGMSLVLATTVAALARRRRDPLGGSGAGARSETAVRAGPGASA